MSSLLLISDIPEDHAFATQVAKSVGCVLIHAKSPEEGAKMLRDQSPKFIFIDGSSAKTYQKFEEAIHETVGLFSELIQPNMIHFISSETMDSIPHLTQSPLFGHLIFRKFDKLDECAPVYARVLAATAKERAFGLENFLRPGTKIQTIQLKSSDQKQGAVGALTNYLNQAKFQPRMATQISNAVDELLMNAIFDAPIDDTGKTLYSNTPRSTIFKLEGKSAVEMQVGFDGEYVGITVVDHYGSLDKARLLNHVSKNYSDETYKLKLHQAGAGIGLATIYQNGGSFFFSSCVRERTEVTVFFRRTKSFVEFKNQFRFFSTQFYF
ncbi:MAG: hypothetical protein P4M08_13955 [Oligoflexia bacterium]|nr:hypothetical protein [Oligoflexia bacterium]